MLRSHKRPEHQRLRTQDSICVGGQLVWPGWLNKVKRAGPTEAAQHRVSVPDQNEGVAKLTGGLGGLSEPGRGEEPGQTGTEY